MIYSRKVWKEKIKVKVEFFYYVSKCSDRKIVLLTEEIDLEQKVELQEYYIYKKSLSN